MTPQRIVYLCAICILTVTGCRAATNPGAAPLPTSHTTESLRWVRYTDSAEGAFSMEVPVGWQVTGGMYRFGYFDVRWMMNARSLDGKIAIRIDDPNVPPYVLPGPHSGPAGHAAVRPQMFQMIVDNYREAKPYAEQYAEHRFASVCNSFHPRQTDWMPTMPEAFATEPGAKDTEASVAFDCTTTDGPRVALVFARSTLHAGNEGLWTVDPILSILATPESLPMAQAMTQHMIDTWVITPEWKQYQDQMTRAGLAQITSEFGQFMHQMQIYHQQRETAMNQQVAHFQAQQNAQAQQVSGWGETLTGLTTVRDSATGTDFQVFSGPKNNYWINGRGDKVNSNLSPGPDFRQMTVVGP